MNFQLFIINGERVNSFIPFSRFSICFFSSINDSGINKQRLFRNRFGKSMYFKNTVHHQGVFYRRGVFERFRYGKSLPSGRTRQYFISGDYELNLLLFLQGAQHIHVNEVIARCGDGISMQGNTRGYVEEILIRHEHIGFLRAIFFDAITLLRYLFKKTTMTVGI